MKQKSKYLKKGLSLLISLSLFSMVAINVYASTDVDTEYIDNNTVQQSVNYTSIDKSKNYDFDTEITVDGKKYELIPDSPQYTYNPVSVSVPSKTIEYKNLKEEKVDEQTISDTINGQAVTYSHHLR